MTRRLDEVFCVPVAIDGDVVYVPAAEYRTNPPAGSYELRERPRFPEPAPWQDPEGRKFSPR